MKGFIAGIIAGFASAIVMTIFHISGLFELFTVSSLSFPVTMQTSVLFYIIFSTAWGIIFGLLYAFFYDYIPGKGAKKGLFYGIIIWIIAPIHNAGVVAMYGGYLWAIPYALAMFFSIGIVYGIILGALYKPTK